MMTGADFAAMGGNPAGWLVQSRGGETMTEPKRPVLAADELGIDPLEIRRKNLLTPDQFPYQSPVGLMYHTLHPHPAAGEGLWQGGDHRIAARWGECGDSCAAPGWLWPRQAD